MAAKDPSFLGGHTNGDETALNTPKKPGTDLAALKARLAKKSGKAENAPADPPAPADIPAPGEVYVPPAPAYEPEPVAMQHEPAYAAPSQAAGHDPSPIAAPSRGPAGSSGGSDTPFGGGGSFDPSAGLIEAGEVESKSNKGLIITAIAGGIAFGFALGWLGNSVASKREVIDQAKAKGEVMATEVGQVAEARKSVSLKFAEGEFQQKLATDPEAAAAELEALLQQNFDKRPDVDSLFGWQLAGIGKDGITSTFSLYDGADRLKADLGFLASYIKGRADMLKEGGPKVFAVVHDGNNAKLAAAIEPLCGSKDDLKPCADGEASSATHYRVQMTPGKEPTVVPRGTGDGQAVMLSNDGMFGYAIGEKPEQHAATIRDLTVRRIADRLEQMSRVEKRAMAALEAYASNPNVDGSNPPPTVED